MSWCLLFTIKYFSRERVCEREHKYGKMNTYKCRWVYGVHYIITHRSLGVTMFQNSDFFKTIKKIPVQFTLRFVSDEFYCQIYGGKKEFRIVWILELWMEKAMATHSSVLAWKIPGMAEPGGLLSMGSHRVGHDWSDLAAAAVELWIRDPGYVLVSLFHLFKHFQI